MPLLVDAVKLVEKTFPVAGTGQQKLAMVQNIMESTYRVSSDIDVGFDKIWPVLKSTIGGLVSGFNAIGIFSK